MKKKWNERCDRLATHVFLFSAKNRTYNKTHIHIQKVELKTLYFNFDSPLQKRFLRSISRKGLTIEISDLDELMFKSSMMHRISCIAGSSGTGERFCWFRYFKSSWGIFSWNPAWLKPSSLGLSLIHIWRCRRAI